MMMTRAKNPDAAPETPPRPWLTGLYALLVSGLALMAFLPAPLAGGQPSGYSVVFHTAVETGSVAIAAMICVIGWAQPKDNLTGRVVILTSAFWGAALLDLAHLLSFVGMPDWVSPNTPEKTIYFWLAARYSVIIGLVVMLIPSVVRLARRSTYYLSLALQTLLVLAVVLVVLYFEPRLWTMFRPLEGPTPLKVALELGISVLALGLWLALFGQLGQSIPLRRRQALRHALMFMAISGLYFVRYKSTTDFHNGMGHLLKLVSYSFLVRALFIEALASPRWQLQDARARLEATLRALPDLLFEIDLSGRFIDHHGAVRGNSLLEPEHFMGRCVDDVLPADVARAAHEAMAQALSNNGLSDPYQYHLTVDGEWRWYEMLVSLKDPAHISEQPHFIVLARDVTEQKQALADEQLNAIAFHTKEAIMITDAERRIVRVNPAFTEITGYRLDEVAGQNPRILSSGLHDSAFYRSLWAEIRETGTWSGELWNKRKDGTIYAEHAAINSVRDLHGSITHYIASFSDITQQKEAEKRATQLTFYDPLTQLGNRRLLLEKVYQAQTENTDPSDFSALLFIDLDFFQSLNDELGHSSGDALLRDLGDRFRDRIRPYDTLARPGGDEFILLARHLGYSREQAAEGARLLGEKFLVAAREPFMLNGREHSLSVSIGITLFQGGAPSADELMAEADLAMYQAKKEGRNRLHFFEPEMQQRLQARNQREADINQALAERQFELYYQPKINAAGEPEGYEGLIRWQHPECGLLNPADFIDLAEDTGQIIPISHWVLDEACARLAELQARGGPRRALAVNISGRHIHTPEFVSDVKTAIARHGIDPTWLHLEITESMLQADLALTREKMQELRNLGVHFELDDFGTGYSSLAYLKSLPIDILKIDQSFVRTLLADSRDAAIIRAIISLAHAIGLQVVAEGVETAAQYQALTAMGCELCQGYHWGRPAPWPAL